MRETLGILTLALVGCQSQPVPENTPALPIAEPEVQSHARVPAMIGHYTLGAYPDPENPLILHQGHPIQRVESAARWNLHSLLSREQESGEWKEPNPPVPKQITDTETLHPSSEKKVTPAPQVELPPAITPDADGIIDLTSLSRDADSQINPFAVRASESTPPREVLLHLEGIIHGPLPCIIVNGHTMQSGDVFESLVLEDIETNSALFRYREHLIRVPMVPQSIRILTTN